MARIVQCPAGQWTALIDRWFVQMPASWRVVFTAEDGGPVEGTFEEQKSAWIIPGSPRTGALEPVMTFERGWWNTFHSVRICPTRTVTARIE
jgi:hypothetical protein